MLINDIMCGREPIIEFNTPTTELQWEVTTFLALTPSCNHGQSVGLMRVMDSYELIHI